MNSIRDLQLEDKEMIFRWRNLPEVARFMYSDHEIQKEEHDIWFRRIIKDTTCRYWIIVSDNIDVGLAGIYNIDLKNRRCEWAFYLADPSVRGKGVGSFVEFSVINYVLGELKLNKLCCEVFSWNHAVIKMHERFGFSREGLLRQHIHKGEEFHDVVVMSILNSDWQVIKDSIEQRLRQKGVLV